MDAVRNPFAPGAGTPPPELAGRQSVLDIVEVALRRIAIGRSEQSSILVGLRGVGKTVLLNRIRDMAEEQHFKSHMIEAHEQKGLAELLVPGLRSLLLALNSVEKGKELARRGLRILKSFMKAVKITYGELDVQMSIDPEVGAADSGDLEADLPELFIAVARCAKEAGIPVLLIVDEMQYLSEKEFSALIMAMHKLGQANLPFTLIGAGLPQILGLAGESKSYAERLFKFPRIGALNRDDAKRAIIRPIEEEGVAIDPEAVDEILRVTHMYPYFLQQWGHEAWNIAQHGRISLADVQQATPIAIAKLDESFFRVRFDRCSPAQKRYMRALAEFGPGVHRSGDIAERLAVKTTAVGPIRDKLIRKGMIYSPQHGETAFTVPLFDEFMLRTIPTLDPRG